MIVKTRFGRFIYCPAITPRIFRWLMLLRKSSLISGSLVGQDADGNLADVLFDEIDTKATRLLNEGNK